jgi:aquaporin Z
MEPTLPTSETPPTIRPIADTRGVVFDFGRVLSAELVGTAVLMLAGLGAIVLGDSSLGVLGIGLAFGIALLAMMYVVGPVSGCHLNPAVTLALLLTRRVSRRHALYAVIGQVVGAILGAALVLGIASGRDGFERGPFGANGWDRDGLSGLGATIVAEILFTALLVLVMLVVTVRFVDAEIAGLAVGLTYAMAHLVTYTVDGTGLNPARSLGAAIFADADPNALGQLWAFIVFPLIGAVVGVVVWLLVDDSELEDTMLDTDFLRAARNTADDLVD